jgi:hypothetical protein
MAILDDTSTVSDDGDWIHSDYSHCDDDEDEDGAQRQPNLGVGGVGPSRRNGEFPPRVVRWLRRKHLPHLLMTQTRRMEAMKCAHWQDSPPRRSGQSKRNDTETETAIVRSESCDRNSNDNDDLDESASRKRPRLGSCHGTTSNSPAIVQRVKEGLGGLPANTDGACEVPAPPITITRHLSEGSAWSVGPRRSQRIRVKLDSACDTTRRS